MKTFINNGVTYKSNDNESYFYKSTGGMDKKGNMIMMRISRKAWDEALKTADIKEVHQDDEKPDKKKVAKPRRSKDIAHEYHGITLTTKQVSFIKMVPNDDFYENGLDSKLWIDCLCDTVADIFSPMAVGAMVSTLKEKELIYVNVDKVNGKKCKYFGFTPLGKAIAKELGLN
jgi:hypothetical protein